MLPPWSCQCSWDFSSHDLIPVDVRYSSHYGDLDPLYIFSHYGDLDLLYIFIHYGDLDPLYIFIMDILIYVYCTWRWPLMSYFVSYLFMAIVLLCIEDCYMYLQLCAELYHCTMLIGWLVFHFGFFITPLLAWTYNVFRPSYDPSDLTH